MKDIYRQRIVHVVRAQFQIQSR